MSAEPPQAAVPGCKSTTQRALMLAALAAGESRIGSPCEGDDCRELRDALAVLGAGVEIEHGDPGGLETWRLGGLGGLPSPQGVLLDCGEGASTLRFLAALAAAADGETRLRAADGLRARPHAGLFEVLRSLGASVEATADGWRIRGRGFGVRESEVPVDVSSQPLSGLLMASGAAAQRWTFRGNPVSPGYLALTIAMQRVVRGADSVQVEPGAIASTPGFGRARDLVIPGDASSVLALAVAVIVSGRPLGLARRWSDRHPDAEALFALRQAGLLGCEDGADGGVVLRPGTRATAEGQAEAMRGGRTPEPGLEFDLADAPDAGPVLAALGLAIPGGVLLHGVARLRVKESDRAAGIRRLAEAAGAHSEERDGALRVHAVARPSAGERRFDPTGDHRLAMAGGIAALRDDRLRVEGPDCVAKSFPAFWERLALLA
jgi:3-phosphoshikimate 1-carboxyvinyltransferase